jgi:hypothetical protein
MVGVGTYMPLTPVHSDILPSIKATNNIAELRQRMPALRQLAVGSLG